MADSEKLIVAYFQHNSGRININRGDGSHIKTVDVPNRCWGGACGSGEIMVAASFRGALGACVVTREGEVKQSIVSDLPIVLCALSSDGRRLILVSDGGLSLF